MSFIVAHSEFVFSILTLIALIVVVGIVLTMVFRLKAMNKEKERLQKELEEIEESPYRVLH